VRHWRSATTRVWREGPPGEFRDRRGASGLAATRHSTGFGVVLADFDRDGHADLAIANGRVARALTATSQGFNWADYEEPNQVFANDGEGMFRDLSAANRAFGVPRIGRGLCGGDIFHRGRIGLLATFGGRPAPLFLNRRPSDA